MPITYVSVDLNRFDLREILLRGSDAWNQWRLENPGVSIELKGANLERANLERANLIGADLRNANLSGANLERANLERANLIGADLRNANLSGAELRNANLSFANLSFANLSFANLSFANLSGAKLNGADLFGSNFRSTIIRSANLNGADLRDVYFGKETFNIKIFDQNIDSSALEQLKDAISNYAEASGYAEPEILSEEHGSFFSKIRYRIAKILSPDVIEEATREGEEFYRRGKEDLKARLEKTGVDSTQKLATATAELLKASEPFDDIILTLGKIILVKYTAPDGKTKTIVRTVSTEIQNKLESTPHILDDPKTLLAFLQGEGPATQVTPLPGAPGKRLIG